MAAIFKDKVLVNAFCHKCFCFKINIIVSLSCIYTIDILDIYDPSITITNNVLIDVK